MTSRKHYTAVAAEIAALANDPTNDVDTLRNVVARLSDVFQADNPNFQRGRFLEACGVAR